MQKEKNDAKHSEHSPLIQCYLLKHRNSNLQLFASQSFLRNKEQIEEFNFFSTSNKGMLTDRKRILS